MKREWDELIAVRGGGDLATGTIHRLWSAGFRVLVLETAAPAAIRRQVCVSEAVYEKMAAVEGMTAELAENPEEVEQIWNSGSVPVAIDPTGACLKEFRPAVLVDAILAKKNLGTTRDMAPLVIGLGPGFEAGKDVDLVIETLRGHNLGRVIRSGCAAANTGIPGVIGGVGADRVLRSPAAGILRTIRSIGDRVEQGEEVAFVAAEGEKIPVPATISGLLRGLIRDGFPVTEGFKIGDIDPRMEEYDNCFTISDKARAIGGSVLEQVCRFFRLQTDRP